MAKFIKDIHDLFGILAGKNIATKQPPERVDAVLYEVVISTFNDHYNHYVKTQKISDYLLPFKREKSIPISNGKGELPPDYAHARLITKQDGTKIDLVEDKFWPGRVKSKLSPPSEESPISRIENFGESALRRIEVVPSSVTPVIMYYFKKPTKPVYAYSVSGSRYVYDDNGSTDLDFDVMLFPQVVMKVLSRFGINLREQQVIQYAETIKSQEQEK